MVLMNKINWRLNEKSQETILFSKTFSYRAASIKAKTVLVDR